MGSDEPVCPACGQPVDTVARRHKTLGAWVPVWVPGPCRNPECGARDEEGAPGDHGPRGSAATETAPGQTTAKKS